MGDQAATGVSEDSSDDHVDMMLWILGFFGVVLVVCSLCICSVLERRSVSSCIETWGYHPHGPFVQRKILPCHCF